MNELKNKKNLIRILILGILILAIPLTIALVRQQQILRGRALDSPPVVFIGPVNALFAIPGGKIGLKVVEGQAASVELRLTSPFGAPGVGGIQPTPTTQPANPTATPLPTSGQATPTPTQAAAVDNDRDGYPAGVDCYDQNPDARPNQTLYFTTHRGDGSFDYNCNGAEESPQSQDSVTTLPAIGCYTSRPSGEQGWVGSLPACGQQITHRRCNANDGLSCSGAQASYSRLDCPDASSTVKSWVVRDDASGPRSCH